MNLSELGWDPNWDQSWAELAADGCQPGRVVAVHRDRFILWTATGELEATACGRLRRGDIDPAEHPLVGDWVVCGSGAVVLGALPRRSCVVRRQPGPGTPRPQPIVANVDTLLLVVGLDGNYRPSRVERYLTIAQIGRAHV